MRKIRNILLIDDDSVANYVHESIIKSLNLAENIIVAKGGEEGMNIVKNIYTTESYPEFVFVDLNMPGMDGFEFIDLFRQSYPQLAMAKVIVLTSSSNHKDQEKVALLKVNDYIVKPLTEEKILNVVQKHLNADTINVPS